MYFCVYKRLADIIIGDESWATANIYGAQSGALGLLAPVVDLHLPISRLFGDTNDTLRMKAGGWFIPFGYDSGSNMVYLSSNSGPGIDIKFNTGKTWITFLRFGLLAKLSSAVKLSVDLNVALPWQADSEISRNIIKEGSII